MTIEQRKSPRKIYTAKAKVKLDGMDPVPGRVVDLSADGVGVCLADPVPVGLVGQVRFDLLLDGNPNTITPRCKVVYCFFSNGEFKTGLSFTGLDAATNELVTRFLG